ncbi:MAG: methylmalonyl Co-A mutase-associated GTPase MeaB [candidate division Zixibacteria bacterium]|nr:methylmalonyl Co-A mutase-associated GTPase MeaB [candidate division Zixibacteria bacterium]
MAIIDRFYTGNIRALSKIISFVESQHEGYRDILTRMYQSVGRSLRIGITGPPGGGKSTLVNGLIHEFLANKQKIGVIAVDPTSPFTGGALLGDRVRMNDFPRDDNVYFRSMATRGVSGGLAAATHNITVVYDAFGFDITLIETVGVGQVELDIVDTCDVIIVVVVPESGDAVQTMKAGLMEIADIFCVNKADRPGAERIISELRQTMEHRKTEEGGWKIPVVPTEAVIRKNVDKLACKIDSFTDAAKTSGYFELHRRRQIRKQIISVLQNRFQRELVKRLEHEVEFDRIIDEIANGHVDPYSAGDELYRKFSTGK